jgi:hypothetical protein
MTGQNNPYTPPQAQLADAEPQAGSPLKAVVLGVTIDIGGTLLTSLVLGIAYGISLAASGASREEIARISADIPLDSWIVILGTLAGCAFSVAGGYVCARIVGREEYRYGAMAGVVSASLGFLLGAGQYPEIANVGLAGLTFLMVLFGARLGRAKNRTARSRTQPPTGSVLSQGDR